MDIDYEKEYSDKLSIRRKGISLRDLTKEFPEADKDVIGKYETHQHTQNRELTVQEARQLAQNAQMENDLSDQHSGLESGWDG